MIKKSDIPKLKLTPQATDVWQQLLKDEFIPTIKGDWSARRDLIAHIGKIRTTLREAKVTHIDIVTEFGRGWRLVTVK